jgi:hypothetical protein
LKYGWPWEAKQDICDKLTGDQILRAQSRWKDDSESEAPPVYLSDNGVTSPIISSYWQHVKDIKPAVIGI